MEDFKKTLSERLGDKEIKAIVAEISGDIDKKENVYRLLKDGDKKVAGNAAWVLTHLNGKDVAFMNGRQDELIEIAMNERESDTLRRLTLNILNRQTFDKKKLRGDFIDYCLETMMATREPIGIRVLSIKLAYRQCMLIPELEAELEQYIEILSQGDMPPAINSTVKQIQGKTKHQRRT